MVTIAEQQSISYTFKNNFGISFKSSRIPNNKEKVRLFSLDSFIENPTVDLPLGEYILLENGKKTLANFFVVSIQNQKLIAIFNSIIKNAFNNSSPKGHHLPTFSKVFSLDKVKLTLSNLKKFSEHKVPYTLHFPDLSNTKKEVSKKVVKNSTTATSVSPKKEVSSEKIPPAPSNPVLQKTHLTFAKNQVQETEIIKNQYSKKLTIDHTQELYFKSIDKLMSSLSLSSSNSLDDCSTDPDENIIEIDLYKLKKRFIPSPPEKEVSLFHSPKPKDDTIHFDEDIFLKPTFNVNFSEGYTYIIRLSQFYPEYAVKFKRMCINFNQMTAFSNENDFFIDLYVDKDKDGFFRLILDSKDFDLFTDIFSPYIQNLYFSVM